MSDVGTTKINRNWRRKKLLDAVKLLAEIIAETPADTSKNQLRGKIYKSAVNYLEEEFREIGNKENQQ